MISGVGQTIKKMEAVMKKTVYMDRTIARYLFDEIESIKTYIEVTKKWWDEERNNFALWISEETIAVLSRIINARLNLFTPEIVIP